MRRHQIPKADWRAIPLSHSHHRSTVVSFADSHGAFRKPWCASAPFWKEKKKSGESGKLRYIIMPVILRASHLTLSHCERAHGDTWLCTALQYEPSGSLFLQRLCLAFPYWKNQVPTTMSITFDLWWSAGMVSTRQHNPVSTPSCETFL